MGRRIIAVAAALLWMGASVLACLPNASMTADEMACCQKMAGHCDELGEMRGGHHKCCDTSVNHAAPSQALPQSSYAHDHSAVAIVAQSRIEPQIKPMGEQLHIAPVEPSASPPAVPLILKN